MTLDVSKCPEPTVEVADVKNTKGLLELFKRAKVVINCVGPFRFFGPPVVEACAAAGTSYIDITGEPEFVLKSVASYTQQAHESGACIVHCCGFDSVPADLGVVQQRLEFAKRGGTCQSVEMVHTFNYTDEYGSSGNYATWESAIEGFGNSGDLTKWRRELAKVLPELPKFDKKLALKSNMSWDPVFQRYLFVFPGADSAVVRLAQRQIVQLAKTGQPGSKKLGKLPPVQFGAYVGMETLFWSVMTAIIGIVFTTLAKFAFGRRLLKQYPRFFSAGGFSKKGPTPQQLATTSFCTFFVGRGVDKHGKPLKITSQVRGPEPGYVSTPICVRECAYTILAEPENCPSGVFVPASAFADTSLKDRLSEAGVMFEFTS